MQILVVDDHKKSRDQLKKILVKAGHAVITASNGTDAFHEYQDNSIDMVFIDWSMPGMGGIELSLIIRDYNLKTGHVAYLVLVSAKSKKRNMVDGLNAGVDDFVLKPFSEEIILSRVDVAKRVLETKYNKIPRLQAAEIKDADPILILNREHVLISNITSILEVAANMLGDGTPLPKKFLQWGTSSAFMLNWQLHEEKELYYIDLFIVRAQEIHGKTAQLFSRSSLKQIMEEHEQIKQMLIDMQAAALAYDINNRKSAIALRDLILRYLPLVRFHAAREEEVFLPFSYRYLTDQDKARILRDFERIDDEVGKDTIIARMETVVRLQKTLNIKEKAA